MNDLRIEFHEELELLRSDLIRLGAMVTETIGRGTAALLDRDLHAAQQFIDGDDVIDDFCLGLEDRCCQLLALQAPIAGDLRFVLTTLRLISELERSADLMVNVCKASRRIYDVDFGPAAPGPDRAHERGGRVPGPRRHRLLRGRRHLVGRCPGRHRRPARRTADRPMSRPSSPRTRWRT